MSEVTKPVETPIVAPTTEAPVETPAVETKATETPAPVVESSEPVVEEAAPAVEEPRKPVDEAVLGYKGPGLLKSLFAQKKFFFFGSEPVDQKSLSSYLRGEEVESANHNAAWAAHTGKGLLFLSKKASDKATPSHIFNLATITDIAPESINELHFLEGGHKHTLIAHNALDRDDWITALKTKSEEAKVLAETIKDTEEYKTALAALTKPVVVAPVAAPKKSTEVKDKVEAVKEDVKEEKAEKVEAKEEKKVEEKTRKSRSASRKRTSIFGNIGFGKKEEKSEIKEESAVAPTETPVVAPVEPVAAPAEVAPTKEASPAPVEPAVVSETRPTPSKRNSIFDSFKSFTHKEKKPEEKKTDESAVVAKEPEPVSETAPVIPAVESSEPLSTSVAAPVVAPVEETPVTNGETKAAETPVVAPKSDKRKSSLPWLSKKKETTTSDEEGEKEKPLSPFAKLRATVKAKSSPKAEKTAEKTPEPVEAKKEDAVAEPIKSEPTPISTTTPQVAATA